MNSVNLVGRITVKPTLRYLPDGTATTRFNLAVDRGLSKAKKEEYSKNGKPTADFPKLVLFGKQAEFCCNYLDKGRLISVSGGVVTSIYEKATGEKVYNTEIKISELKSLEYKEKKSDESDGDDIIMDAAFEEIGEDIPF
ncbi:MAG: single-stranded DNA-binding protein [Acidaminobacteraceae bacterium]